MKNYNFYKNVIKIYFLSLLMAIVFSPLFGKLYILIFKPLMTGGLEGLGNLKGLFYIQSAIFSLSFFIPLFIIIFLKQKKLLFWLIGIFIPFTMVLVGGKKHILWFIIFTITGVVLGWLAKWGVMKFKKTN